MQCFRVFYDGKLIGESMRTDDLQGFATVREPTQTHPFFMVWCPERGQPTVKHYDEKNAYAEAERLARNNPSNHFYILRSIAIAKKVDVQITEMDATF